MNQRINELAEQAGLNVILDQHAHEYGNGMLANTSYPEVAKFAELIITKCAVIATRCESNGNKNIGAEILEHFGVEE